MQDTQNTGQQTAQGKQDNPVKPDNDKTTVVSVNKKPVKFHVERATGLQIKEAAIAQRVTIKSDFLLFDDTKGAMKPIDDNTEVELHGGQKYIATAPDDNS